MRYPSRYAEMEDELPPKRELPSSLKTSKPTTPKKQAPAPPQARAAVASSGASVANAKKRAPSPPSKHRAASPPAKSSQKRWEVMERTAAVRSAADQPDEDDRMDTGERADRGKDSALTFAQAQALAKAREEAYGIPEKKSLVTKARQDPSEAKVADKAKSFEKAADPPTEDRPTLIPKSK